MVAEQYIPVSRHVIEAVIVPVRRRLPSGIYAQDFVGDKERVEPVSDEIDAQRGDHQPRGIDGLAPAQRDNPERHRAQGDDGGPEKLRLNAVGGGNNSSHRPTPVQSLRDLSRLRSSEGGDAMVSI